MATQGLVTIKVFGKVAMKIVAGIDGDKAKKVADAIRNQNPLPTAKEAYDLASNLGFGSEECLVVMTPTETVYKYGDQLHRRYRDTFYQPEFNPRWEYGTADFVEVVEL